MVEGVALACAMLDVNIVGGSRFDAGRQGGPQLSGIRSVVCSLFDRASDIGRWPKFHNVRVKRRNLQLESCNYRLIMNAR